MSEFEKQSKIVEMSRTDGWEILEKILSDEVQSAKDEMMDGEIDFKRYLNLKEIINANKNIINIVKDAPSKRDEASEQKG